MTQPHLSLRQLFDLCAPTIKRHAQILMSDEKRRITHVNATSLVSSAVVKAWSEISGEKVPAGEPPATVEEFLRWFDRIMRNVLKDRERKRNSSKREATTHAVAIGELLDDPSLHEDVPVDAFLDTWTSLAELSVLTAAATKKAGYPVARPARAAAALRLHLFGNLTLSELDHLVASLETAPLSAKEISKLQRTSPKTVYKDLEEAKGWVRRSIDRSN